MPQSRSHGGQAANFCVGGKIGRKAGKSGSINLAACGSGRLLANPGNLHFMGVESSQCGTRTRPTRAGESGEAEAETHDSLLYEIRYHAQHSSVTHTTPRNADGTEHRNRAIFTARNRHMFSRLLAHLPSALSAARFLIWLLPWSPHTYACSPVSPRSPSRSPNTPEPEPGRLGGGTHTTSP